MGEGEEGGGRGRRRGGPTECSIYFVQDLGASVSGRGARAKSVTRACVLSRARVKSVTRACVLSRARLTNLAPVVRRLDSAINRINRYPADKC